MLLYKFLGLLIIFFISQNSFSRQVSGRPTLPSDCHGTEHWVRGHSKSKGIWTAFCRANQDSGESTEAYKFWAPRLHEGNPLNWPNRTETVAIWTELELEKVLSALEQIPLQLWTSQIRGIYRLHRSKDFPNPGSSGDGFIALYDAAFMEKNNLVRILSHEGGHEFYSHMSNEEKSTYRLATGWGLRDEPGARDMVVYKRKSGYVRRGCEKDMAEDLACNIEFFLLNPDKLKTEVPGAYVWIRNRFGDNFKLRK